MLNKTNRERGLRALLFSTRRGVLGIEVIHDYTLYSQNPRDVVG